MSTFGYTGGDGCPLSGAALGTSGPVVVLLHGGGPDHESLLPLAHQLADRYRVLLPDVRGYGRSRCPDPALHTWDRYVDDVWRLLDHEGGGPAVLGGTGLGATITLRAALARPDRVLAGMLISAEDIEDDDGKEAETQFLDAFAATARAEGLAAAWAPILPMFPPVIGAMVRDAIPRADPASIAAAAHIGHDRAFRSVHDLIGVDVPILVIPGGDPRHPPAVAAAIADVLPQGRLAPVTISENLHTADDLAEAIGPAIQDFLGGVLTPPAQS